MLVVFGIILLAFVLFVTEAVPVDIVAIILIVLLVVLEPWTEISLERGLSGFANEATITILTMFILSEGIRRSGAIQRLSRRVIQFAGADEQRQLLSVVGISGISAGFINNTPVVAVLIPLANDVASKAGTALSKLLIPISFAAMLGGMLTLIGTSTSLLASSVSARVIGRRFTMFEFTHLGIVVLLVGSAYLIFIGRYLLPDRRADAQLVPDAPESETYLIDVRVGASSPWAGQSIGQIERDTSDDIDIVEGHRDDESLAEPLASALIEAGDVLLIRAPPEKILQILTMGDGLSLISIDEETVRADAAQQLPGEMIAEVVVVPPVHAPRDTIESKAFRGKYDVVILGIRRGDEFIHDRLDERSLQGGDTLLVLTDSPALRRLNASREFVVLQEVEPTDDRSSRIPLALGIVAGVVLVAATGAYPLLVAALAGVIAMVLTGCLRPTELYDAVDWSIIFLLAGVIPLGVALERTGGAKFLADVLVGWAGTFPPIVVLALVYLLTTILTEIVSNNASVVLMIPIAVDVAQQVAANEFAFILGVTFAASTSVLTPIGYQTNLMVYGAGGYQFTDFFKIGAPLQIILTVVTTLGIALFWGL